MHFGRIAIITVSPFHVNVVALFDQSGTRHVIGNHHRAVIDHMTRPRNAEGVRITGIDINGAVVLNDSVSRGVSVQRHCRHAGVGSAFCPEVDGAVVHQLRVVAAVHTVSVVAADIHGAIVFGNVVTVGKADGFAVIHIVVNHPSLLIPEKGITAAGIRCACHHGFSRGIDDSGVYKGRSAALNVQPGASLSVTDFDMPGVIEPTVVTEINIIFRVINN